MLLSPELILQKYWGYRQFRPGQREVVQAILDDIDTLAIMPTGGGKSICFQVPALMLPGTMIVVSPLISLMKDQVEALCRRQLPAAQLTSAQTDLEKKHVYDQLISYKLKLIYVSPERLQTAKFINICKQIPISRLVIDEAHCISEWGHDFRPEYIKIADFIRTLLQTKSDSNIRHHISTAAFTATATPQVRTEIITSLNLQSPKVFLSSFKRTNLKLNSLKCSNNFLQNMALLKIVKTYYGQNGLVYTASRAATENLAAYINGCLGVSYAAYYHAGLEKNLRNHIQQQFIDGQTPLVIATNAFGMGIDKSDIRYVIHYHLPASLEHYYQEVGRAGRDGQNSSCFLLYQPHNLKIHLGLIEKSAQGKITRQLRHNVRKLEAMRNYCQTKDCRSSYILNYFGEKIQTGCGICDNCTKNTNNILNLSGEENKRLSNLMLWRRATALRHHLHPQLLASDRLLYQLAVINPQSDQQLHNIAGLGLGWQKHQWPEVKQVMLYNT